MAFPGKFNFKNPDYREVFEWRIERIKEIRKNPKILDALKVHYRMHPEDLIEDFGCTIDPRLTRKGFPSVVPFILFEKQREWVMWAMERWQLGESGITVKSRDCGCSWLLMAFYDCLGLSYYDINLGVGSRKSTYVDEGASPKSLFYKARKFAELLPEEFRGGWVSTNKGHSKQNLIYFPETGSTISGESGDSIGRGDRASLYTIDEAAFIEHPDLIDASLSATTESRIDISTPCGMANSFARKAHSGNVPVFIFHWRDDPRKDDAWYAKKCREIDNPIIIAQELDLSFTASVSGILIPNEWIEASVDAHIKLGFEPSGIKMGAFDVADEGRDKCAYGGRHAFLVNFLEEWSGKGSDTFESTQKCFLYADLEGHTQFQYDGDGLGAGVRGDSRIINEGRAFNGTPSIGVYMFRGSASGEAMHDPDGELVKERKNRDFFANMKAQSWWSIRERFKRTYRAVVEGMACNPEDIISLSSELKLLNKLKVELSQPTYELNTMGKVLVNKAPEGTRSPNLADDIMMLFNPGCMSSSRFDDWA